MHKDAYLIWKENEVTKAFMREMQEGLNSYFSDNGIGNTLEELGLNAAIRRAKIQELEKVLKWKPEEVNDDSNN